MVRLTGVVGRTRVEGEELDKVTAVAADVIWIESPDGKEGVKKRSGLGGVRHCAE